jgi:hypothetical protein
MRWRSGHALKRLPKKSPPEGGPKSLLAAEGSSQRHNPNRIAAKAASISPMSAAISHRRINNPPLPLLSG